MQTRARVIPWLSVLALCGASYTIGYLSTPNRERSIDSVELRRRFKNYAVNILGYVQSKGRGQLPTDFSVGSENCVAAKPNSWRMAVLAAVDNLYWFAGEIPWYSPQCWEMRSSLDFDFCQPGSTAALVNSVRNGGIFASHGEWTEHSGPRSLIAVEAYPDGGSWLEAGDLNLRELLDQKSISEALSLEKAKRSTFMAIFSDFSTCEVRASIPKHFVHLWLDGTAFSEAELTEVGQYIVWKCTLQDIDNRACK